MEQNIFLKKLKQLGIEGNIPNISEKNALFLRELIRKNNYVSLLEIGTANGYSTINFAYELQDISGHITTIEFSALSHEQAKKNFIEAGINHLITPLLGNALSIVPNLQENYDFIFIDGMKKRTLDFYLLVKDKLKLGGMIVIDDVIKFGNGVGKNGVKMQNFYDYLHQKGITYEIIPIDEDDGIMLIRN